MTSSKERFSATLKTLSLADLFQLPLRIPDYQRSYSWQKRHVEELLKDISGRTTPYLMGTVILHSTMDEEKGEACLDIVDGQQRLVTLTVLWHTIDQTRDASTLPILKGKFSTGAAHLIREAQAVIQSIPAARAGDENAQMRKMLAGASSDINDGACLRFYVLTLCGKPEIALDRAYTFFDSVNSKGKRLSDFDLLKAHHLMFIPAQQESVASTHNENWSSHQDDKRQELFSWTLRRIRMWSRGRDRDASGERPDYDEFSSVVEPAQEEEVEHRFNRYMQPAAFRSWRREGGKVVLSMDYPTPDGEDLLPMEITQTIEGGDAFFLYARRYHELYEMLYHASGQSTRIEFIRDLAQAMSNDHLRNAFKAVMLLYTDKFGEDRMLEVGICVERIISSRRWATLRVRTEGTLTHVKDMNLVPILLESASSRHALEQLLVRAQAAKDLLPTKGDKASGGDYRTRRQEDYRKTLADFYDKQMKRFRLSDDRIKVIAEFTKASAPK